MSVETQESEAIEQTTETQEQSNVSDLLNSEVETESTQEAETETEQEVETERPDWLPGKFKDAQSMAESYKNLEGKFGVFTGAPEEGYSEESLKDLGDMTWFKEGEAGLDSFKALAADMGVNQEGFDKLMTAYVASESERAGNLFKEKIATIHESFGGEQATKKAFAAINSRTKSVLGEEGAAMLKDALDGGNTSSVSVIKLINGILDAKQGKEFKQPTKVNDQPAVTEASLQALVSDPKYKTDREYRKQVAAKFKEFYDK
ncbi:MAG: hypothetical protein WBG43_13065 [Marinifilaceae bacterium]